MQSQYACHYKGSHHWTAIVLEMFGVLSGLLSVRLAVWKCKLGICNYFSVWYFYFFSGEAKWQCHYIYYETSYIHHGIKKTEGHFSGSYFFSPCNFSRQNKTIRRKSWQKPWRYCSIRQRHFFFSDTTKCILFAANEMPMKIQNLSDYSDVLAQTHSDTDTNTSTST